MAAAGLRAAVVGATGALGTELLIALDESRVAVAELVPIATDRSLGAEVDFQGASYPIETAGTLEGVRLVFLCAPPSASLEWAARAVRAGAAVIDLSGALAAREEAPLVAEAPDAVRARAAVVAVPSGPALAWIRVLAPLARALGVTRVVGTALVSAGGAGRAGIEALQAETVALLAQEGAPETGLDHPLAFDLLPWGGSLDAAGEDDRERALCAAVARALGGDVRVAATCVRVPTFCGDAASLAIELAGDADPERAAEILGKAEGVALLRGAQAPNARAAAGTDFVWVGRLRRDPTRETGLLLWLAADSTRLAALQAVRVAEARFASA
jgi:aspartate-semialdehyde dehydrogenase